MAELTLNKDGSPRKRGSGKTKGAGCFTKIKWSELQEFVGENTPIPVSRVWLRGLGVPTAIEPVEAKTTTLEEPSASPEIESPVEPPPKEEVDEDPTPMVAVTPPYRYAQDFDL